ncbi:hypothetical protein [Pseudomonas sp. NPDC090592]|uniref:hypothetical protein n=1 Tax=Pseudomonas sp. NPDC090592 TaxID=3364480 RepID=UPI00383BDEA2
MSTQPLQAHRIRFLAVYDARFDDSSPFRARWCDSADFTRIGPLVPQGLQALLHELSLLS